MRILEDCNTEKTLENLRARNRSDNENSREPELSWIDPQVLATRMTHSLPALILFALGLGILSGIIIQRNLI